MMCGERRSKAKSGPPFLMSQKLTMTRIGLSPDDVEKYWTKSVTPLDKEKMDCISKFLVHRHPEIWEVIHLL